MMNFGIFDSTKKYQLNISISFLLGSYLAITVVPVMQKLVFFLIGKNKGNFFWCLVMQNRRKSSIFSLVKTKVIILVMVMQN